MERRFHFPAFAISEQRVELLFKRRSLRRLTIMAGVAKRAQHVVLIHFPIAVFVTAVAFDYLAQWTRNETLAAAAWNSPGRLHT
jgi:hypothetical protein